MSKPISKTLKELLFKVATITIFIGWLLTGAIFLFSLADGDRGILPDRDFGKVLFLATGLAQVPLIIFGMFLLYHHKDEFEEKLPPRFVFCVRLSLGLLVAFWLTIFLM
jgi:hypothetical protein